MAKLSAVLWINQRIDQSSFLAMNEQNLPRPGCAFLIRIQDMELRKVLQQYPLANTWDEHLNEACRKAVLYGIEARSCTNASSATVCNADKISLSENETASAKAVFQDLWLKESAWQQSLNDFGWKVALLPREAKRVLCVGPGAGEECIFLRARLPRAEIVAVDFKPKLRSDLQKATDTIFHQSDISDIEKQAGGNFDLVFTNHFLEHMSDPDATLASFARLTRSGGIVASGLPLDGMVGVPFRAQVERCLANPRSVHPLDFFKIDAGHPWKTNLEDLRETLAGVGFSKVSFYRRDSHMSRYVAATPKQFERRKRCMQFIHNMTWGIVTAGLKVIFPKRIPLLILKGCASIYSRTPFGPNRVKNNYAPEVFFIAQR